jgi:hypothetical protein
MVLLDDRRCLASDDVLQEVEELVDLSRSLGDQEVEELVGQ